MAKNSIRDYSATNSSNTDIQSIDISEGCSPAGINNAIREVMADLKDVSTGAVALESPAFDSASLTGDLTFGDNDKAIFGAGSDLQIYSNVGESYILEGGTGHLNIRANSLYLENAAGDNYLAGVNGAGTYVYYNGSPKLETTSTGVDVTGTITTSEGITYDGPSTMIIDQAVNAGAMVLRTGTNSYMRFDTNGSNERMRINNDGNLLINTTSPNNSYQTTIQSNSTKGALNIDGPATNGYWAAEVDMPDGSTYGIVFRNTTSSNVGNIRINASSTSYNTTSDYRLKTAVTYDWDATTRLKQLRPARFEWISDGDDAVPVDGFLAHEVQDIVPEAISGTKDAMRDEEYEVTPAVLDEDGNEVTPAVMGTRSVPDYQGIDQSKLVPLLVKTIQELEARITALEAN